MATQVLRRHEQKTGNWGAIFPNEQTTEIQSSLFVKKLVAVSVSNIAYLRGIFPEPAFGERSLEGLNLKVLREDASCPGASLVIRWMKGCFDALDKKYLRMLMIGLYCDPENPETVLESYIFKFSYTNGGSVEVYRNNKEVASAHSDLEARKATLRLLRTIILLTNTLDSLPPNVMMTMKLFYYDEVTPVDYEPPGFKASDNDNFVFEEEPVTIKVGDVSTMYHNLSVRVKTDRKQFEMKNSQTQEEPGPVTETEIEVGLDTEADMNESPDEPETLQIADNEERNHEDSYVDIPQESPAKPIEGGIDTTELQMSQTPDAEEDYEVKCPCGVNKDDGLMVLCSVCKMWQHGVCFVIIDQDDAPEQHLCDICAKNGDCDVEPTDPYLSTLTSIEVQATCLWRRALVACLDMPRVTAARLTERLGTEEEVARGLLSRLQKEGFVKSAGKSKRHEKIVNREKLIEVGIPNYLKKQENVDVQNTENENPTQVVATEDEVTQLAEKTGSLKLSHKREKLSRRSRRKLEEQVQQPEENESQDFQTNTTKKRRDRKRTVSKRGLDADFELSSTQDVTQDVCDDRKRRKKTSVVANPMVCAP
ncbi:HORMA domain-containing protein 1 [Mactra antiquata]